MKRRVRAAIMFLLLFFPAEIYASTPRENYLWIEFQERVKEKDYGVTMPLRINYGIFPGDKKGFSEFDSLRAFYAVAKDDDESRWAFYEAEIERVGGECLIKIKSSAAKYSAARGAAATFNTVVAGPCPAQFIVFVEGKKGAGEAGLRYSAKTSFALFGHSSSKIKYTNPVSAGEVNRQLEIFINPQFYYWPQTGDPVEIVSLFNKGRLPEKAMRLFDENMPPVDIMTDERGSYVYVPPEDKKLNRKSETAFKQSVIVAREEKGGVEYVSSYTLLLHRPRSKCVRPFLGPALFCGAMAGIFLFTAARRKRFKI